MRGGGSSRQSPVARNLIPSFFEQSPQDGAERSRSDKGSGSPLTPLSDLDLSDAGIDAREILGRDRSLAHESVRAERWDGSPYGLAW